MTLTPELASEFPIIILFVIILAMIFGGLWIVIRWVYGKYEKNKEADLKWKAEQNEQREKAAAEQNRLREVAVAEQNKLWREAMAERDARYEQYDRERQGTLNKIATSMEGVIKQIADHDQQAKDIFRVTRRIDENTRPLPGTPGYERRHAEGD